MNFYIGVLVQITLFIVICQCFNLMYGYTNMLFLGIIGMEAIGAYSAGLLNLAGFNFSLTLLAGFFITGFIGFLLAIPTIRFKADYLAIVTLGFGEIIRSIIINWTSLTRGPLGIPGIKRPVIFGFNLESELNFFLFTLGVSLLLLLILRKITSSPFGKILETIREDDIASQSIGKSINAYRVIVITFACGITGIAGALNVYFIKFTEPNVYSLELLALVLLAVFAGGPGKFYGTVIAASILMLIRELFLLIDFAPSIIGPLRWIVIAGILVTILIHNPNGLFGKKLIKKNY